MVTHTKRTLGMYLERTLRTHTKDVHSECTLWTHIGNVHWGRTLGMYIGDAHWECTLGTHIGNIHWSPMYISNVRTLGMYIGDAHWELQRWPTLRTHNEDSNQRGRTLWKHYFFLFLKVQTVSFYSIWKYFTKDPVYSVQDP